MAQWIFAPAPVRSPALANGPVLSLRDLSALQKAPRRGPETTVTVRAYDIPGRRGVAGRVTPDHMYVEYDDGREQIIARGGPSGQGPEFARQLLTDDLHVVGEVTPARESRDYGRGERVLFRGRLPGVTAQAAAEPARRLAERLRDDPRRYRGDSNSNSFVGDVIEPTFHVRPGDRQTWGWDRRLETAPRTQPFNAWGYRPPR